MPVEISLPDKDDINHKISACISELKKLMAQLPGKGITEIQLDGRTYETFGYYVHSLCGKTASGSTFTYSDEFLWNGIKLSRNDRQVGSEVVTTVASEMDYSPEVNQTFFNGHLVIDTKRNIAQGVYEITYVIPKVIRKQVDHYANNAYIDQYMPLNAIPSYIQRDRDIAYRASLVERRGAEMSVTPPPAATANAVEAAQAPQAAPPAARGDHMDWNYYDEAELRVWERMTRGPR